MKTDIVNIVLTKSEYRELLRLKRGRNITHDSVDQLRKLGFVDTEATKWEKGVAKEFKYSISSEGLRYIQHIKNVRSEQRWTRWLAIIAIFVSLASLAVSVASLLLQFTD